MIGIRPHERKVGWWGIAVLTFFNVSGGPWGSEPIVSSAGPLPGWICLMVMAVFWGLPLCWVTAEMSAALPSNGGYVLWVDTAFGGFWGFQESFWSWGSCVVDNALYPVLAYETILALWIGDIAQPLDSEKLENEHSWIFAYGCKLLITLVFSFPVLMGRIEWITKGMTWMIIALSLPFAVMLPYIGLTRPLRLENLLMTRPNLFTDPSIDWVGLINVTFWNFNGFDCASTCAGEVKNPGKNFPRGLLSALVVTVVMTACPLFVAVAVNEPEWQLWQVGWWTSIAHENAGISFAWTIVVSSLIGTFGMHAAVMWEESWQVCGMAEQGLAPRWLAGRNETRGTPENASMLSLVVVMFLVMFDFRSMVIVDNFFSVASGLLEIFAFAHLKQTRPGMERPFSVPLVKAGWSLVLFLIAPISIGTFVLLSSFHEGYVAFVTLIPILLIGFALPRVFRRTHLQQVVESQRKAGLDVQSPIDDNIALGTVYGAMLLPTSAMMGTSSPTNLPNALHFETIPLDRESWLDLEKSGTSQLSGHEVLDMDQDRIFHDPDAVHFNSIFTDPIFFRDDDDEDIALSANDENWSDDPLSVNMPRSMNRYPSAGSSLPDEFLQGADEERSYDDVASLD